MAGRKRKPTKLHLIQGTARPCRINKSEPAAPNEPPSSATELDSRASFWFGVIVGRLQSMGVASSVDSEQVMLLAIRLAEIDECNADIKQHGRTTVKIELIEIPDVDGKMITKAQKYIRSNPAVAQRSEAMRHAQSLLAEFGLSPASRGKVSKQGDSESNANPWEAFK